MPKPADPLSDTLYDMPTLNRLFFVSSILLIAATVWMAWQDYDRNWKHFQRDFNTVALKKAEIDRDKINARLEREHPGELKALAAELEAATKTVEGQKDAIAKIRADREAMRGKLEQTLQHFQFAKSESDTLKYRAEKARVAVDEAKEKGHPTAGLEKDRDAAVARFDDLDKETQRAKKEWEEYNTKDVAFAKQIDDILKIAENVQKKIVKLETDLSAKKRQIVKLEPSWQKDLLNAPGVDFVQPSEKIQQLILPHFLEDVNFSAAVFKVDRCTTCHLAIDKKGWTKAELEKGTSPAFFSHPNLELYVGDNSPHPMSKFGCTICHNGQGRSVDFNYAAHTPKNEEQAKEWKEKYSWEPVGHYDTPMLPTPYAQAACTKCHGSQHRVTMADKLNEGKRLVETVGCYGCHPILGTEDLRKPGPSLYGLKYKVTKDWAFNWISKPTDFRPTTKMPQPFFLSNTSDEESKKRNTVMIQGIIEYLWENENLATVPKTGYPAPPPGNAANGKKVVESVGCVGCHIIEGFTEKGNEYRSFGPNLTSVGSKLNAGWTFAWLKNPKQYFHYTSMPMLRLTDEEAADATAFLMSMKHPDHFEDRKAPEVDDKALHETVVEFKKGQMSLAQAEEDTNKLSQHEQLLQLGFKAISQMGCFGCHDIKGFETTKKIGAELTGSNSTGTKDITKFDFGFHEDLQHGHHPMSNDRINWVRAKLENPRIFDSGRIVAYFDKLRMPKFNLSEEQNEAITTYVLSFRRETVNPLYLRTLSHSDEIIDRGKRLVTLSNCAACHKVGVWPTTMVLTGTADGENNTGDVWGAKVYAARQILTDGRQVETISDAELAILRKKGTDILVRKGTWITPDLATSLLEKGITNVLVYGEGEAGIKELVEKTPEDKKAPPYIVGEGAKVNPDWLFRFLKSPFAIRPWLANKENPGVRMPTFGFTDDQAMLLVEHFARVSGQQFPFVYREPVADDARQKMIATGKKVFDENNCGKCHVVKGVKISTDSPAPAFAGVGPRIQYEWFDRWIRDPQSIAPGVSMPSYSDTQVRPEDVPALKEFIWSLSEQDKK
ncbi:MAG: c-type cytochrome [Planctomycetes bacterium]|nr:c-type cytochrome [Planctomycetota bacterium]